MQYRELLTVERIIAIVPGFATQSTRVEVAPNSRERNIWQCRFHSAFDCSRPSAREQLRPEQLGPGLNIATFGHRHSLAIARSPFPPKNLLFLSTAPPSHAAVPSWVSTRLACALPEPESLHLLKAGQGRPRILPCRASSVMLGSGRHESNWGLVSTLQHLATVSLRPHSSSTPSALPTATLSHTSLPCWVSTRLACAPAPAPSTTIFLALAHCLFARIAINAIAVWSQHYRI